MNEIFGAVKTKNKIVIASSLAAFAVILITVIGILGFVTADTHKHVYEYSLDKSSAGKFSLIGICKVDNCESPYYAEVGISGVKILSAKSSTCSKEGEIVYTYTTKDGKTVKYVEKVAAVAHTYEFEFIKDGSATDLKATCQVDGCGDPVFTVKDIKNFEEVAGSSVPGDCFTPGQKTYSYLVGGTAYTLVTLVEEKNPHSLNGVLAIEFADENGIYPVGVPGIIVSETVACGAVVDAHYVCENCKQLVEVQVAREDHKFLYDISNVQAPDASKAGLATLICHNPECSETVKVVLPKVEVGVTAVTISEATENSPLLAKYSFTSAEYGFSFEKQYYIGSKLEHEYTYKLALVKSENGDNIAKIHLIGTCNQVGCQTPTTSVPVDAEFVSDTSTCLKPGTVTWKYNHNGTDIYLYADSVISAPHNYEVNLDLLDEPRFDRTGLITLTCTTEGCVHKVDVDLPEVVLGENGNTVYSHDDEYDRKVYLYTYYSAECNYLITFYMYLRIVE